MQLTFRPRRTQSGWIARFILHVLLFGLSVLCLLPLVLVISASLSDERAIARTGYSILPSEFTTFAYRYIFNDPSQIVRAYGVTIIVTLIGSALGLLIMSLLAYGLSRKSFAFRRPLAFFVLFTMLFNAGLVPWYIVITQVLHLKNTLAVLILPYLVVPWFVLLLRTYFVGLPETLLDAARIDGASEWRVFFQIVLPLSTPSLATVGLFCMLMYWNDWWLGLLFIDDRTLYPLQLLLYTILRNIQFLAANTQTTGIAVPTQSVRMALAVLAIGPIMFAFLTVQRYFVRGITLGGLKDG